MTNKRKKGFTLTEMIVVIAIIGILAGVLIPTIIGYIKRANMSADQQAVAQMNKILSVEEIDNKPETIEDVREIFNSIDFDITDYKPLTKGTDFYWVVEINKIIHVESNTNKVLYPKNIKNLPEYSETSWIPLFASTPTIEQKCEHEFENLTDINWLKINDVTLEATCNEEGIVASAFCNKCNKSVENVYVKPIEHKNKVTLKNYEINGVIYDEIKFDSSYCEDCGLPVAFVEQSDYNLTGNNPWDVTYSFKPFSCDNITAIKDGNKVTLDVSVFDLMYANNGELLNDAYEKFINKNLSGIDPLVLNVFGVKSETELGAANYFGKGVTFSIGFNVDVNGNDFAIGGHYENFGTLDDLSEDVSAYNDYVIDILADFVCYGFGKTHSVITDIVEFKCGFTNKNISIDENTPIYATVKLLIEGEEEGSYEVISLFKHQVTKPYAYEASKAYNELNDSKNIYQVIDEAGKVYYGYEGEIYDLNYLKNLNVAVFNTDGSVEFQGQKFVASEKNLSTTNTNIKIYLMEVVE